MSVPLCKQEEEYLPAGTFLIREKERGVSWGLSYVGAVGVVHRLIRRSQVKEQAAKRGKFTKRQRLSVQAMRCHKTWRVISCRERKFVPIEL